MRDEFRERFFTPFVMPLTIIGLMLVIGYSLSRVLLAVPELSASLVALLMAGYVMAVAFLIERRKRISARTLGVSLAIGLIGLLGAGAVASAAGMRALEEHGGEEGGEAAVGTEEGGEAAVGTEEGGGEAPDTIEPVFVAIDIAYESAPEALPVGDVDVSLVNDGQIEHNVVIEELGDELILDAPGGGTDEATVSFEAGDYTYYCSIPGHRGAGMEGTLSVSADVEAGGDVSSGASSSDAGSEGGAAPEGGSASQAAAEG